MKVKAEGIDAELGNNGITLHIATPGKNNNKHIGTLGFGRATLKWKRLIPRSNRNRFRSRS